MAALGCILPFFLLVVGGAVGAWAGGTRGGTVGLFAGFGLGCVIGVALLLAMRGLTARRE